MGKLQGNRKTGAEICKTDPFEKLQEKITIHISMAFSNYS
jgi:hypothetical protein